MKTAHHGQTAQRSRFPQPSLPGHARQQGRRGRPVGSGRAAAALLLIAGFEGLLGLRVLASPPTASWWLGSWTCTNGGRPAALTWRVVNNPLQAAGGGGARPTTGLQRVGRFSETGGAEIALANPRQGQDGGLFFRAADRSEWFLARPADGKARGWSIAAGQRVPLICWRRRVPVTGS